MTFLAIALFLLTDVILLAAWFYYKRTKRLLHRNREEMQAFVAEAFTRIETRLVHGISEFKKMSSSGLTWAIVFTYNRKALTLRTLETLRRHEPDLPVLVIDNGSTDGTRELLSDLLEKQLITKVLFNRHEDIPQWQKSFAINQALKLLALETPSYIVWMDDDLEIERPFVKDAIALLNLLKPKRVRVINMTDNAIEEKNHPTIERISAQLPSGKHEIKIRATFNGQFDFYASDFFAELGPPPIGQGFHQWGVEDWYYSRRIQAADYRAAVYVAATHVGYGQSKREEMQD